MSFDRILIDWYLKNKRDLPWRTTRDPYPIWLSEIILQQTRVEQGMKYFYHFIEKYPTVFDLAKAHEDEVLRSWQGLGYYSRARNLHKASKMVAQNNGIFPGSFVELQDLPGVGSYTAAAIASFCYDEAVPVIDGNVFRFLSRYLGIEEPINSSKAKKIFFEAASLLIPKNEPANFNQGMMEMGSLVCKPKNPKCSECPFQISCLAYSSDRIEDLPKKIKKTKVKPLHIDFYVIKKDDALVLKKRGEKGIWAGLYEFPNISTDSPKEIEMNLMSFLPAEIELEIKKVTTFNHLLSHKSITANFIQLQFNSEIYELKENEIWVANEEIENYGVHRLIEKYLESNPF